MRNRCIDVWTSDDRSLARHRVVDGSDGPRMISARRVEKRLLKDIARIVARCGGRRGTTWNVM